MHRIQSLQHRIESILHRRQAPGRRKRLTLLAASLENVRRLCRSIVQILQRGLLTHAQLEGSLDPRNRQPGAARRGPAAQSGNVDFAARRLGVLVESVETLLLLIAQRRVERVERRPDHLHGLQHRQHALAGRGAAIRINGWRTAWAGVAVGLMLFAAPIVLLLREGPVQAGAAADSGAAGNAASGEPGGGLSLVAALRTPAFWVFGLAFKVAAGAIHILLVIAIVLFIVNLVSGRRTRV